LAVLEYIDESVGTQPAAGSRAASSAFFWLSAFFVVYCARPEDWVPGLKYVPLAKITGICALWGLSKIGGLRSRVLRSLPRESSYLLALIAVFYFSAVFSPVWPGGALSHTIDFSKCYIVWLLTYLLVTDFTKFRRIVFIQTVCVVIIALVSIVKGHNEPRLAGVLGGIYSNPNDLAFSIVLCLPFALAFLLSAKSGVTKAAWLGAMLLMAVTLALTASRAGFVDLVVSGTVCLWHFGVKGKRPFLIVATAILGLLVMLVAGRTLKERLVATASEEDTVNGEDLGARGSYEARKYLMQQALRGIEQYPILGLGVNNFITYSGDWHEVHMSYLQIAVEGGIPALILYLLFFSRGFVNLKKLQQMKDLDAETVLFVGALHSSLVGFVVGALFAPEGYQFFPYFTIGYTSALLAIMQQRQPAGVTDAPVPRLVRSSLETYAPG
jgi:putative inorganic carbon (hco3(-)) transporter